MAKGIKTGGRKIGVPNKATADIKFIAQEYTENAISVLVNIMKHGETEASRVAAAKELLDRGHGKSKQSAIIESRTQAVFAVPYTRPEDVMTVEEWSAHVQKDVAARADRMA